MSILRSGGAAVTWLLAGAVCVLGVIAGTRIGPAWAGLAGLLVLVTVLPALASRRLRNVPPWPLLVIGAVPIAVRTVTPTEVDSLGSLPERLPGRTVEVLVTFADAAALAALALLVVAVLQQFTSIRMTTRFGSFFVVVTTVGLAGFWAVARWAGQQYLTLDTGFVTTNRALMVEFAATLAAGVLVALLFGPYFCRARPAPARRSAR